MEAHQSLEDVVTRFEDRAQEDVEFGKLELGTFEGTRNLYLILFYFI